MYLLIYILLLTKENLKQPTKIYIFNTTEGKFYVYNKNRPREKNSKKAKIKLNVNGIPRSTIE